MNLCASQQGATPQTEAQENTLLLLTQADYFHHQFMVSFWETCFLIAKKKNKKCQAALN